jgi:hypothetical protein
MGGNPDAAAIGMGVCCEWSQGRVKTRHFRIGEKILRCSLARSELAPFTARLVLESKVLPRTLRMKEQAATMHVLRI